MGRVHQQKRRRIELLSLKDTEDFTFLLAENILSNVEVATHLEISISKYRVPDAMMFERKRERGSRTIKYES